VEYAVTVPLLRQLGYDPDSILRGSLTPEGYSDGVRNLKWRKPDHWERIQAAMLVDEGRPEGQQPDDAVNHPSHYTSGPKCECGRVIECITVIRDHRLAIGNAMKYLWRNGLKRDAGKSAGEKQIEDLRKAVWFIEDEIAQLERANPYKAEGGAGSGAR